MIKKPRNALSIRSSVVLLFSGVLILTGLLVGYLVFSNWITSANITVASLANALTEETSTKIVDFLHEPQHLNQINHKLIESGVIDLQNAQARDRFFVSVIGSQEPYLYSFSYGGENGEYYGARRTPSGEIEIIRNNDSTDHQSWYYSVSAEGSADKLVSKTDVFDPRTRDWYKAAKSAEQPVFSSPYKHFVMDDLAISAAYPLYDKHKELMGVLGTHLLLSDLERYLYEGARPNEGDIVIVERTTGKLIANTYKRPNYQTTNSGEFERLTIDSLKVPNISNAYKEFIETGALDESKGSQNGTYIHVSTYSNEGVEWLIISAVSNNLLMREVSKNIYLSIVIALISGFIALLSYFFLTKRFMTPLTELVDVSNKIASGQFGERATIRRYDEIGVLGQAFNDMAQRMAIIVDDLEEAVSVRTAEIQQSHDELRQHQDTLQLILDSTAEAIYGIDLDGNCMFCNQSCIKLLGYQNQSDLLGKNMHWLIHHSTPQGDLMPLDHCKIYTAFTTGQSAHVDDEVFWKADGTPLEVEYYSYPQYNQGQLVGAVITFMDNSERRRHEEQIQFLSTRDSLTGLYNRRHFETMLASLDRPSQLPLSILFADTNGLKLTNDVFGHSAGDELVVACAEALTTACRETDIVARVGGDEFVVLLPQTTSEDAQSVQARIEELLGERHIAAAVRCSMSMGQATKHAEDELISEVLEAAENAMYRQKTFDRQTLDAAMIETLMHSLYNLAPLEREHAHNVSTYSNLVGQELGMSPSDIKKLTEAALLHDIGKVAINPEVMNNTAPLNDLQREEMKRHTTVGYRILNLFDETLALADGIYAHHEHWDGSGYPKGLTGTEIPLAARIIAVAETYDALRSARGNRAYAKEEALALIESLASTKFDPSVVEAFMRVMRDID